MNSIKEKIKVTYDFTAAWGKFVSDASPPANKKQYPTSLSVTALQRGAAGKCQSHCLHRKTILYAVCFKSCNFLTFRFMRHTYIFMHSSINQTCPED